MPIDPSEDQALTDLIQRAGITTDLDGLRSMMARIAASPATYPADAWMRLLAADPDERTKAELRTLRAAMAPKSSLTAPAERLDALRAVLKAAEVDGFILPRADEHQGEYLPDSANRLSWLTGFTGSAGVAVVLADQAALFADGRYTIQAEQQVDGSQWQCEHLIRTPPADWVSRHIAGKRLGFDAKLHSIRSAERLRTKVERAGGTLVALDPNPVDAVWSDRPSAPLSPVEMLDETTAGLSSAAKQDQIGAAITEAGADATVLNQPESIAWLLNIRGQDTPFTPLPLSYATVEVRGEGDSAVTLFIDPAKLTSEVRDRLGALVSLQPFDGIAAAMQAFGKAGKTVVLDPDTATDWMRTTLEDAGARILTEEDPCVLPRARKNAVEIAGIHTSHARDAVALSRFLRWIDETAPTGRVTEMGAVEALERFRSEGAHWRGPSFSTISGSGPNGAIVHYRVTPKSDRRLQTGELYLVDSGAQYVDGTTDVTRTVAIGTPTQEMRERFTLVLKGHIAIATAKFPAGTSGSHLDALARQFLWKAGLDFDHGTGHGVGSFLGVHEGPQRLSSTSRVPIEPGMFLSNEPGYYKTDAYGIRIENLILAVEAEPLTDNGRAMIAFETVTFAPIDRRLVAAEIMTAEEIAWLDAYHAKVREIVSPALDPAGRQWLEAATAAIGDGSA
jgi:Xaa-Pro aminopeptidase